MGYKFFAQMTLNATEYPGHEKSRQLLLVSGFHRGDLVELGDLNPRPQSFFEQFYMCSRLI